MTEIITRLQWRQIILIPLGLALLWPAVVNGSPFLFPDTTAYIRSADALAMRVFGQSTTWSNSDVREIAGSPSSPDNNTTARPSAIVAETTKPVLLGRSIFYGALAYTGVMAGSLWIPIILQAIFVSGVVLAFLRHFIDPSDNARFTIAYVSVILALMSTPIAYFVSMIMPDVFAGTTIISAAALVTGWRRETGLGRMTWASIAGYGALAHSSHVLILLTVAIVAIVVSFFLRSISRTGAVIAFSAACIGIGGEALFSIAVEASTGAPPIRPPFITARLVDDGPGLRYLREHCGQNPLLLCRYRNRLPLASDEFLWGANDKGVFSAISVPEQRMLAAEQSRFVWAVVTNRPLDVAFSTSHTISRQAMEWNLPEFNLPSAPERDFAAKLPDLERLAFIRSAAYRNEMPTRVVCILTDIWLILGFISFIIIMLFPKLPRIRAEVAFLITGWVLNVAICGALSTPHDRYHARVIWISAVIALLGLANNIHGRKFRLTRPRGQQ